MAEEVTIARPYAEALYRLARERKAFAEWSQMLQFAAAVAADAKMRELIGNPKLTAPELERLFVSVCDKHLDAEGKNLVAVLVENGRLSLLPQIHTLFERLRAEQEGVLEAEIAAAFPLSEAQQKDLINRLESRFKRKVTARVVVDPELIGGVKIVAGDVVIDASVQGRLQDMASTLKH